MDRQKVGRLVRETGSLRPNIKLALDVSHSSVLVGTWRAISVMGLASLSDAHTCTLDSQTDGKMPTQAFSARERYSQQETSQEGDEPRAGWTEGWR